MISSQSTHGFIFDAPRFPLTISPSLKKVLIVLKKLLKACFSHINKLNLCLCRSARSGTSLNNILLSAASSLNHLVNSTVPFLKKPAAEIKSHLIYDISLLIAEKFLIVSDMRYQFMHAN